MNRRWNSSRLLFAGLLYAGAFLGWRFEYASTSAIVQQDEIWAHATVMDISRGVHDSPYLKAHSYLGCPQELVASAFVSRFPRSELAFRIPAMLFIAAGVGFAWLLVRDKLGGLSAALVISPLVFANSTLLFYTSTAYPAFAITFFLATLLPLVSVRLEQTSFRWKLLLAFCAGIALYTHRILIFTWIPCIACLVLGPPEHWKLPALSRSIRLTLLCLAGSAVTSAPLAYVYLTRPEVFQFTPFWSAILLLSSVLAVLGAVCFLRADTKRIAIAGQLAVLGGVSLIIPVIVQIYFKSVTEPALLQDGYQLKNTHYSLHHFHDWIGQINLLFTQVIPGLITGGYASFIRGDGANSIVPVFIVLTVSVSAWVWVMKSRSTHQIPWNSIVLLGVPALSVCLVLAPSWHLNDVDAVRYLGLFATGFFVILVGPAASLLGSRRGLIGAIMIGIMAWNWHDTTTNEVRLERGLEDERVSEELINRDDIDVVTFEDPAFAKRLYFPLCLYKQIHVDSEKQFSALRIRDPESQRVQRVIAKGSP